MRPLLWSLSSAVVLLSQGLGSPSLDVGVSPDLLAAGETRAEPRAAAAWSELPLTVGGFRVPLRVMGLPVLPGGRIPIVVDEEGPGITVTGGAGRLQRTGPRGWTWTAPGRPGSHRVRVVSARADTVDLHFFVLRPATEVREGRLNGYEIGAYRARPANRTERYAPPAGFIEAPGELYDIPVSPNFTLGQFLCKQPGDPRYLLVSPRLLIKLERILEAVNERGIPTRSLTVMSGFRTPAYNRAIGNTTDFSRHLFGDAADIFVDNDGDGDMDDLNGDGRTTIADARWLADLIEEVVRSAGPGVEPGGLSVYRRNAVHGPFVHVDTRGSRARW